MVISKQSKKVNVTIAVAPKVKTKIQCTFTINGSKSFIFLLLSLYCCFYYNNKIIIRSSNNNNNNIVVSLNISKVIIINS